MSYQILFSGDDFRSPAFGGNAGRYFEFAGSGCSADRLRSGPQRNSANSCSSWREPAELDQIDPTFSSFSDEWVTILAPGANAVACGSVMQWLQMLEERFSGPQLRPPHVNLPFSCELVREAAVRFVAAGSALRFSPVFHHIRRKNHLGIGTKNSPGERKGWMWPMVPPESRSVVCTEPHRGRLSHTGVHWF